MSTYPHNQQETPTPGPSGSVDPVVPVRGDVLPRVDVSKLTRHLPELRRIRIEINGVLAGCPAAIPDAVPEFATGWAFFNRFFDSAEQLGKTSSTASHVSLMVENGADLDRLKYEAIGWIPREDLIAEASVEHSARPPRSVPVMTELDAISTCQATFRRFDDDGAKAGYVHVALSTADDVLCMARDVSAATAAQKVFGWMLTTNQDCSSTMLVVRGILDDQVMEAASRIGVPVVATDAVPTAAAIAVGETRCTSIIGLALSYRRAVFVDGGHLGGDPVIADVSET